MKETRIKQCQHRRRETIGGYRSENIVNLTPKVSMFGGAWAFSGLEIHCVWASVFRGRLFSRSLWEMPGNDMVLSL